MIEGRFRFYSFFTTLTALGHGWLWFHYLSRSKAEVYLHSCPVKLSTNLPCPSCGSTRSALSLIEGDLWAALYTNPMGLLVAAIMLILPLWIAFDLCFRKNGLMRAYKRIELIVRRPQWAIPLAALVLLNWIWNISKGL